MCCPFWYCCGALKTRYPPYAVGAQSKSHGANYYIVDPERAFVKPAKMQLGMLLILLENGAKRAKEIIAEFKSTIQSKKKYFVFLNDMYSEVDRIIYNVKNSAVVKH